MINKGMTLKFSRDWLDQDPGHCKGVKPEDRRFKAVTDQLSHWIKVIGTVPPTTRAELYHASFLEPAE